MRPHVPCFRAALLTVTTCAVAAAATPASAPRSPVARPALRAPAATRDTATSAARGVTPEAESLLTRMARRYRGLNSYQFEGATQMTLSMGGQDQTIEVPFRLAAVKPGKMRNEVLNPMVSVITVSDGVKSWMFVPQSHQYTRQDAPATGVDANTAELAASLAMGTPIQRYLSPADGLLAARILGESVLEVDGRTTRCALVEAQYAPPDNMQVDLSPNTLWVDAVEHIVLRDSVEIHSNAGPGGSPIAMRNVTRFHTARVDQPVADSLFTFTPPADAQLVDKIGMPGQQAQAEPASPLEGKPAKDFTLRDMTGKAQRLSALKGKVVLIDFWATWCGPCRREMPTIVKLHKELAAKGLVVVGVNVGESASEVRPFLRQNGITFPVWLDPEREVAAQYGANAIPTLVVVDRTGKVSTHTIGLHDEASLREMLKKAGLKL